MSDTKFYIVLLGSIIVTLIPRVIPFFMAKYINFPDWMTTFTIIWALFKQKKITIVYGYLF